MTHKIHSRYIPDTYGIYRDTHQDTYLELISSPTCGRAWIPPNPRDTCPACTFIPYVSRMYSACIPHVSWLPLRIHVSRMYLACIPHVSFISDTSLSGCIWDTCISSCISDVSQMYLDHPCRYMYLACIPHVSCISDTYRSGYIQEVSISDNVSHMYPAYVSWCIVMYREEESKIHVSWCILTCIQCDTKEAPKIHVSWCIWCVSQNVSWTRLGYVWNTCKMSRYMYSLEMYM